MTDWHRNGQRIVVVPDESGMGEEEIHIGVPTYDHETRSWIVWESEFFSRPATEREIKRIRSGGEMPLLGWLHYGGPGDGEVRYLRVGRGRWRIEIGQWGVYVRCGRFDFTIVAGRAA